MISKIVEDYRHKVVKFAGILHRGLDLYLPYSKEGFVRVFVSCKDQEFSSFYYKFENVSRKVAQRIGDLIERAKFTGVFSRDKKVLDDLIQQNL